MTFFHEIIYYNCNKTNSKGKKNTQKEQTSLIYNYIEVSKILIKKQFFFSYLNMFVV